MSDHGGEEPDDAAPVAAPLHNDSDDDFVMVLSDADFTESDDDLSHDETSASNGDSEVEGLLSEQVDAERRAERELVEVAAAIDLGGRENNEEAENGRDTDAIDASASTDPPQAAERPFAGLNANADEYIPLVMRAAPQRCAVELKDFEEEDKKGALTACFNDTESWQTTIRSRMLRDDVQVLYPTLLPLQKKALSVIKTDLVDVAITCPHGQGSTTSWMLPVIDRCLTNYTPHPGTLPYLILVPTMERAEYIREEMRMFMPRFMGRPSFDIDILIFDEEDKKDNNSIELERKVMKFGGKVIIAVPSHYRCSMLRRHDAIRHIIVDHFDKMYNQEFVFEIFEQLKEEKRAVKTTFISDSLPLKMEQLMRRDLVKVTMTPTAVERPRWEFAYITTDDEAYKKLREILEQFRDGTTIIFVYGYDRILWEDFPKEFSHLSFGFLKKSTSREERWRTLIDYRTGCYNVLVAPHEEEKHLQSRYRTFDVNFVLPGLYQLEERLKRRNRIYRGDSVILLCKEDACSTEKIIEIMERDRQDTTALKSFLVPMIAHREELLAERRRKLEESTLRAEAEHRERLEKERREREEWEENERQRRNYYDDDYYHRDGDNNRGRNDDRDWWEGREENRSYRDNYNGDEDRDRYYDRQENRSWNRNSRYQRENNQGRRYDNYSNYDDSDRRNYRGNDGYYRDRD